MSKQKKTKEKNWKCDATLNVIIALSIAIAISFGLLKWSARQKQKNDALTKQIEALQNFIDSTLNADTCLPEEFMKHYKVVKQYKNLVNKRDSLLAIRKQLNR